MECEVFRFLDTCSGCGVSEWLNLPTNWNVGWRLALSRRCVGRWRDSSAAWEAIVLFRNIAMKPTLFCLILAALWSTAITSGAANLTVVHSFGDESRLTGFAPQAPLVQSANGTLFGTASGGEGWLKGVVFSMQPDGSGFTVLKYFGDPVGGATPLGGLVLAGSTLYGTTSAGGEHGMGTVFALGTNGSGFTNLYSFTGGDDGREPHGSLIISGNVLYGTTAWGGSGGFGAVFAVRTDGSEFTNLYSFNFSDGQGPQGTLVLAGNVLYGTTFAGGSGYNGTIFAVRTDGTGFTNMYNFNYWDGAYVYGGLALSGNRLYGSTGGGGSSGVGTLFTICTDGTGFTNLFNFSGPDGMGPDSGVMVSGSMIYGTTQGGGSGDGGTVFAVQTDGSGYSKLHEFTGSDGAQSWATLLLSGNTLYGTTSAGGGGGEGSVFAVRTSGDGFADLYDFRCSDGATPSAGLLLVGDTLYGTTAEGGNGAGTLFAARVAGGDYTYLHSFPPTDFSNGTNCEGANPVSALIRLGDILYGTTQNGGTNGAGTVFAMPMTGFGYSNLHNFAYDDYGTKPRAGLTGVGGALFGLTYSDSESLFGMNLDGTGMTNVHDFNYGSYPRSGMIASGNRLYGTTGGSFYGTQGNVFSINADGSDYFVIHEFGGDSGAYPHGGVVLSGDMLYGTTSSYWGGQGTVFAVRTDGAGFTNLHSFSAVEGPDNTNADGADPEAGLVLAGETLYGTTCSGGANAKGVVFAIRTDGSGFTNLWQFSGGEGMHPCGDLVLGGDTLYGTASEGGNLNEGTVFALNLSAVPAPILGIQMQGGKAVLSWEAPGFSLQRATNVSGPYTTLPGMTSPCTNDCMDEKQFFRLQSN